MTRKHETPLEQDWGPPRMLEVMLPAKRKTTQTAFSAFSTCLISISITQETFFFLLLQSNFPCTLKRGSVKSKQRQLWQNAFAKYQNIASLPGRIHTGELSVRSLSPGQLYIIQPRRLRAFSGVLAQLPPSRNTSAPVYPQSPLLHLKQPFSFFYFILTTHQIPRRCFICFSPLFFF